MGLVELQAAQDEAEEEFWMRQVSHSQWSAAVERVWEVKEMAGLGGRVTREELIFTAEELGWWREGAWERHR